jgi:glyoxylase-like metal-dependent hydrolase (beta-lactamase superfamily II)
MAEDVLSVADRLWSGELDTAYVHPVQVITTNLCEPLDGVAFVASFANVSALKSEDGLVMVDTGSKYLAQEIHESLRAWSQLPLNTAVYSHGHIDHVFGVGVFEEEAKQKGWPSPTVVAHDALPARFDRYIATAGYNGVVNARQFGLDELHWPTHYRYPDRTYSDQLSLDVGGVGFELHHARGETDDHTWTWFPDRKVLCSGDLFIWASPNAGNPQKVQRYPSEWAAALREMASLAPEVLLPGHGLPVVGAARIAQALTDTAELLESLVAQTLELMNAGARLDEAIHSVRAPGHLLERPYLRPVYDEPEFVVRNIWRQYGGWWDGNPSTLKPAPEAVLAAELADLAGGTQALVDRAVSLAAQAGTDAQAITGQRAGTHTLDVPVALRLAAHLVETAALASPNDPGVERARADVFSACAEHATSTMAKGVFTWAARESRARSVDAAG